MVRGAVLTVTPVCGRYQCAEMQRIDFGRGRLAPISAHASVYPLHRSAFMGLPCPKKIAGRVEVIESTCGASESVFTKFAKVRTAPGGLKASVDRECPA